jgi:putative heme-binding domain-containing protein
MTRITHMLTRWLPALVLALSCAAPALAQRDATVPDPDPESERRSFEVAEGFEVNLFAADPLLAKPIQINFDPAGRLWVASSEVYPQIKPGQVANDKVLVLEDKNADGQADTTTVFADGLLIPTGIAPGDGGAYVANSTELLHLKDSDGDGKADTRRIALSGFGTEDTHHIIHTFRWGHDGQLYFNQSTYIHSHIETPWGTRRLGGGGIWNYRPEMARLEIFTRGLINPWGHITDAFGQSFATDGAGGEGINYMIPGASYAWTPGAARIVAGLNPGSPKYCGLEIVSGRHMPDDMQGVLVTNDFRAHRVCRFVLSDDGSGFGAREIGELIKTRHGAFRPIDVAMGPDGAIYIADWYNPIIQHGEVDFRDPRRDQTRGRIWRVTAKNRPLVERPPLPTMSVAQLLDQLRAPEGWTRQQAKRLLKERGAQAVLPELKQWLARIEGPKPHAETARMEALWVHQALDVPNPELLTTLLSANDPRVRAAAVRVIPYWMDSLPDPLELLKARAIDTHPRVRLEAVRALAHVKNPEALSTALQALDQPIDTFLDYALWLTARELQPVWLPALQAGKLNLQGNPRALAFALQAAETAEVIDPLLSAIANRRVPEDGLPGAFRVIGMLGNPDQLAQAVELSSKLPAPDRKSATLLALAHGSSGRAIEPARDREHPTRDVLASYFTTQPEARGGTLAALEAVAAWRFAPLRDLVSERAQDPSESTDVRLAAIQALERLGGEPSVKQLDQLSGTAAPPPIRRAAIIAAASLDIATAARRAAEWISAGASTEDAAAIVAALAGRKGGPEALAADLSGRSVPKDVAKLAARAANSSGQPAETLISALRSAGGLAGSPAPPTPEEVAALVSAVAAEGDPARGEAVFRRPELQCQKCHAVAGAGGIIGPSLESIGASAQVDYLIDSLLLPTKTIKEGYHSRVLATTDGRVLTGIVQRRDGRDVVLRDADGNDVAVPISAIEEEKDGTSLMPEGLSEELTRPELVDLVRFLSELGKAGPYAVGPARLVRRWETLPGIHQAAVSVKRVGYDAMVRGVQPTDAPPITWQPAYSKVSGDLPLDEIAPLPDLDASDGRQWIRFALDVTTPGQAILALNATDGLTLWLDGDRLNPAPRTTLNLTPGRHTITFAINPDTRTTPTLRCELQTPSNTPAQAHPVLGP